MNHSNHYPVDRMTPEERREEIASLLALGLVRLRAASVAKSANVVGKSGFQLGFTGDQSVHTDTVNNLKTESQ